MQATTTKIGGRRVVCVIARQKQHVAQLINRSAKQSIGDSGRSLRGPKLNCVGAETHPYQRLVVGFIGNVVFPHFSHLGRAPELGVLRDFVQIFSARAAATWLACLLAARIFVNMARHVYSQLK